MILLFLINRLSEIFNQYLLKTFNDTFQQFVTRKKSHWKLHTANTQT